MIQAEKSKNNTRTKSRRNLAAKLIRQQACADCGKAGESEIHHNSYDTADDVVMLCRGCHSKRHSAPGAPGGKRGRPAGTTKEDARREKLALRVSAEEREKIERHAQDANLPLAEYARRRLLKQRTA
jgi:hypothetical protein